MCRAGVRAIVFFRLYPARARVLAISISSSSCSCAPSLSAQQRCKRCMHRTLDKGSACRPTPWQSYQLAFGRLDNNNDKTIDFDELCRYFGFTSAGMPPLARQPGMRAPGSAPRGPIALDEKSEGRKWWERYTHVPERREAVVMLLLLVAVLACYSSYNAGTFHVQYLVPVQACMPRSREARERGRGAQGEVGKMDLRALGRRLLYNSPALHSPVRRRLQEARLKPVSCRDRLVFDDD